MITAYITLLVALFISVVSEYYSIVGLTAIFAASVIPVVIMGIAMAAGKLSGMIWLHKYWKVAPLRYKLYLVPAVTILMLITAMGSFGFLSKAHIDQGINVGDVSDQVVALDDRIKSQRDNIDADRKALAQMDTAVNEIMARTKDQTDTRGAERSVQLRRSQASERDRLQKEIKAAQIQIEKMQEERAPIAAKARKVDAEVGPIKYIAAFIYGDAPDQNLLERAVRWVIILIIGVLDPLALVLLLGALFAIEHETSKRRDPDDDIDFDDLEDPVLPPLPEDTSLTDPKVRETPAEELLAKKEVEEPAIARAGDDELPPDLPAQEIEVAIEVATEAANDPVIEQEPEPTPEPVVPPVEEITIAAAETEEVELPAPPVAEAPAEVEDPGDINIGLTKRDMLEHITTLTESLQNVQKDVTTYSDAAKTLEAEKAALAQVNATLVDNLNLEAKNVREITAKYEEEVNRSNLLAEEIRTLRVQAADMLAAQTPAALPIKGSDVRFGTAFPLIGEVGDMFLLTSVKPSRLYKWNGTEWVEVDKNLTDSYAFNDAYIDFLIEKLTTGEYSVDDINSVEHELITKRLQGKDDQ